MKNKSVGFENINCSYGMEMYCPNKFIVVQPDYEVLDAPKDRVKKQGFLMILLQLIFTLLEGLFMLVAVVVMVVASALFFVLLAGIVLKLLLLIFG